jgi:uncharacterized repeat protein (TIGR03943 family)
MLLFGGAILRASLTDLYLRYVKDGLRPFLLAAGLLLTTAAVMTLWYELRPSGGREPADAASPGQDEQGHTHHEPRVGWLLIAPVLALVLVAPPALGAYAAGQAGTILTAQNADSDYPPLPAGDPVPVSMLDYASRAIFDEGKTLTGRTVVLTGFVTAGTDGRPMLARMILSCCAADGRPIKVALTGDTPTGVPADTWVQVTGGYVARQATDTVNGAPVPYLQVTAWKQITRPRDPYE